MSTADTIAGLKPLKNSLHAIFIFAPPFVLSSLVSNEKNCVCASYIDKKSAFLLRIKAEVISMSLFCSTRLIAASIVIISCLDEDVVNIILSPAIPASLLPKCIA